jgi:hypothetical protein
MAIITNYATLQTEVANWLSRDDLTTDIPAFIQFAENKLYRTLNLRNEETTLSESISSGAAIVPTDFKALKYAYYDGTEAVLVDWTPIEDLYRDYPDRSDSTTCPQVISREANTFIFGPAATDGTLKGVYYAKQDPLRTTDPSWYVTNAPEVLLYGSLLEAVPFIKDDPRIATWKDFFRDAVQTLKDENENAEVSRGQLRQKP